jgi:Flp pilus assembly pilin Flp
MLKLLQSIPAFLRDEEGQDIIEYGLLAAFIAIVVAVLLAQFSDPLERVYQGILDQLNAAAPAGE